MMALSVAIISALDTRTRLAQNYAAVLFRMMILTLMVRPITMTNERSTRTSLCQARVTGTPDTDTDCDKFLIEMSNALLIH